MTDKRPPDVAADAIVLWRDSRRAQGWALFAFGIWMLLYIGQAIALWIIVVGILATTALLMLIIIKFRPRQPAAWVESNHVTTPRLIMPPRRWRLEQPPEVSGLGDEDQVLMAFKPQGRGVRKVVFWRQQDTLLKLQKLGVQVPEELLV
ncbi:MAG: hypothetical protein WEA82_02535 [Idiomarina sp.]